MPGELVTEAAQEDRFFYKRLTYDDFLYKQLYYAPDTWPVDFYTCALSGDL